MTRRLVTTWLFAASWVCVLGACPGKPASTPADAGRDTGPATLDTAAATTATVDSAGGILEVARAGSTLARLEIPAGAVADGAGVAITMTPWAALAADFPVAGALAVKLEPAGLAFRRPVTLHLSFGSKNAVAFALDDSGRWAQLLPHSQAGGDVVLSLTHFSGYGAGEGCPVPMAPLPATASAEQKAAHDLAVLAETAQCRDELFDAAAATLILDSWYVATVKPGLEAAAADKERLDAALREYLAWTVALNGYSLSLPDREEEARQLAAAALGHAIGEMNADCAEAPDLAKVARILEWLAVAQQLGLDAGDGLDAAAILEELCVEVVIERLELPPFAPGQAMKLTVQAGLSFAGGPPGHDAPLRVSVTAEGTAEAGPVGGSTDDSGVWTHDFVPAAQSSEVRITAKVCVESAASRRLSQVCQTAVVVRGTGAEVLVSPARVSLEPGETQRFAATIDGTPSDQVDWTATGGTIHADGTYTAGTQTGSFEVTATARTGGRKGSATVEIVPAIGITVSSRLAMVTASGAGVGRDTSPGERFKSETANASDHPALSVTATANGREGHDTDADGTDDDFCTGSASATSSLSGDYVYEGARLKGGTFTYSTTGSASSSGDHGSANAHASTQWSVGFKVESGFVDLHVKATLTEARVDTGSQTTLSVGMTTGYMSSALASLNCGTELCSGGLSLDTTLRLEGRPDVTYTISMHGGPPDAWHSTEYGAGGTATSAGTVEFTLTPVR